MNNQNNNGCGCHSHPAPGPGQPADISMTVCERNANVLPMLQTYTTKVLKPNISSCCRKNILTQQTISCEGYKYVIKWDFDLNGQTITVPKDCILEFDGGSLKNGTIIGQDTLFINVGDVDIWGENLIREGTWREKQGNGGGIPDKDYDPEHNSGLGRKTLELKGDDNTLTQEDFGEPNTVYVLLYDFSLNGAVVNLPENCVLDFEGGSIKNGCLVSNMTKVVGPISENDCLWGVYYDGKGNPLSYKYTAPKKVSSCINQILSTTEFKNVTSPQSIVASENHIILFCHNNNDENVSKAWAHLFDRNYNYLGKAAFDTDMHCNGSCIKGDFVYIATWDAHELRKARLSDIINTCTGHSSAEIQTSLVFTRSGNVNSVCYDTKYDQFAVLEDYHVTVYDGDFNLIRRSTADIRDLYDVETVNQQAVFRNGQYIQAGWNSPYYTGGMSGSSLFIIYDCATDTITSTKTFMPFLANSEFEAIYFDPYNDDEIYIAGEKGGAVGGGAVYIGKASFLKDVVGVSTKWEEQNNLANVFGRQYVYVNNEFDPNNEQMCYGDVDRPFKSIYTALNFIGGSNNVYLRIVASGTEYNIGNLGIDGTSFVYIRGVANTAGTISRPDIRGSLYVQHGAEINLNNLNIIGEGDTLGFNYCGNITVQSCDLYKGSKSSTSQEGTHVILNTASRINFELVNFHYGFDAIYTRGAYYGEKWFEHSEVQFRKCTAEGLNTVIRTGGNLRCGNVRVDSIDEWIRMTNCNKLVSTSPNAMPCYDCITFVADTNDKVEDFLPLLREGKVGDYTSSLIITDTRGSQVRPKSAEVPNATGLLFRPGFYYILFNTPVSYGKGYSIIRGNEWGNWNNLTQQDFIDFSVKSDEPVIAKDQDENLIFAHVNYESNPRSLIRYDGYSINIKTHGATADRPKWVNPGFMFFDEDLGKPVFAKTRDSQAGVVTWVDSTGQNA